MSSRLDNNKDSTTTFSINFDCLIENIFTGEKFELLTETGFSLKVSVSGLLKAMLCKILEF